MTDLYGRLLAGTLFPAFEAVRGRPTVPLLAYLRRTERWAPEQLRQLQAGLLRRLLRHAYNHTEHYRRVLDDAGIEPEDIASPADLVALPLLDRPTLRATMTQRTADAPPCAIVRKTTSGSSGNPAEVLYNAESRHWRDATRWRGYGWGGYRIGMRALHYWGVVAAATSTWWQRTKTHAEHRFKRDLYLDCTPRSPDALDHVVGRLKQFRPQVVIAYASGAGALARFINDRGLRDWDTIPVLTGAETLLPHDRAEDRARVRPGVRHVRLPRVHADGLGVRGP